MTNLGSSVRRARLAVRLLLAAAACLSFGAASAVAQDYPARPITMVVPFPAGGTTDILGRVVANVLAAELGQSIVVQNVAGAGGNIGTTTVAQATPDGYTILMGTVGTHAINPSLYRDMPFDHIGDFTPISRVATVPNVLVVNPNQPFATVPELIAYAKERPSEILYGSSGNGTSIHLSAELFKVQAGVNMTHVPYAGSGPAVVALMGNEVALMFDNLPSSIAQIRSGALRAVAVTPATRSPSLPDVPTIAEAGLAGFEATSWFGLFVPDATPPEIVERLNAAVVAVLAKDETRELLAEQGAEPVSETSAAFATFIEAETAKWAAVVEQSGASVD